MQIIKFAVVGGLATLIHYLVAVLCIELLLLPALLANAVAYITAVGCSYFGHTFFTFQAQHSTQSAIKFIIVSLSAFALSQAILQTLTIYSTLGHRFILLIVVFSIPAFSFVLNKYWVYKGS